MSVKLFVFLSGYQTINKSKLLSSATKGQKIEIPVPYYLIDLGKDKLLVDTGISERSNSKESLSSKSTILEDGDPNKALSKIGLKCEDVNYIIHTHLHFDHAANTKKFKNAQVIVQLSELRAAFFDDPLIKHGYVEEDIRDPRINWKPIVGMKSLFNGTILIFPTFGHTPGHQSVLVRLKNHGNIIIAGDVAPIEENLVEETAPGVASNPDEAFHSLKSLKEFARFENAKIWSGHDPNFYANIKLAPDFYD